tara:strand:- start:527 stop:1006 length:480 start_codon:yes stop_codon:yes gene_type:complete
MSNNIYTGYDGDEYRIPSGLKWDKCFSINQLITAWYKCYGEKLPEQHDGFIKELISIASTLEVDGLVKSTEDFNFVFIGAHFEDKYKVEKLVRDNLDDMFETGLLRDSYELPLVEVFETFLSDSDLDEVKKDIRDFHNIKITASLDNQEVQEVGIDTVY